MRTLTGEAAAALTAAGYGVSYVGGGMFGCLKVWDVQGPHRTFGVRPFANEERAHWTLRVRYPAGSGARLVYHRAGTVDGQFLEHPVEIGVQAHVPAPLQGLCRGSNVREIDKRRSPGPDTVQEQEKPARKMEDSWEASTFRLTADS